MTKERVGAGEAEIEERKLKLKNEEGPAVRSRSGAMTGRDVMETSNTRGVWGTEQSSYSLSLSLSLKATGNLTRPQLGFTLTLNKYIRPARFVYSSQGTSKQSTVESFVEGLVEYNI